MYWRQSQQFVDHVFIAPFFDLSRSSLTSYRVGGSDEAILSSA